MARHSLDFGQPGRAWQNSGVREGFAMTQHYPVEGDSAIAEVVYDEAAWADLHLEDIDVEARGDARTENARVVLRLYGPSEREFWEFDFAGATEQLLEARDWLLEHESAREPVPERDALTRGGEAWSKMSPDTQRGWSELSQETEGDENEPRRRRGPFRRKRR
jgi:hypothetical protein